MALEQKSTVIGEYEYTVTQLPARQGKSVAVRLGRILAPLAKEGADGEEADKAAGLVALFEKLDDKDVDFLCDVFMKTTSFHKLGDMKQPELSHFFDEHFAGRYGQMFKWLQFCAEVNFGSFLGEVGLQLPVAEATKKAA